ncbi:hypothetical protein SISNIDRAFT_504513 [Sistotremastrum niveocremeum HHB9708]|uniref:Uncharacterized protein n=1 Tax=Sistotremastrum niveocremeum HHB9708 TaxID=1314777 RepID=A0A164VAS2_9AGAM|nr:hypothetical protein SISNIDRAFT_504513 [Sistotremastrum niveocremeum HHB9708]
MSSTANAIRNKSRNPRPPSAMIHRHPISSFRKPELFLSSTTSPSIISMPLSADVNASLLRTLKIVQSLGEAVPHGGVLKAIAGIGITILETVEVGSFFILIAQTDADILFEKRVRLNKKECADIARRAVEHIWALERLDKDEELSEDLAERLERYHRSRRVLEDVSRTVERIGSTSKRKSILRSTSVQEETRDCLDKLNEAYQMYIFQSSIAADSKLTTLVNGMQSLSLRLDLQSSLRPGESDEIPLRHIEFGEEITRVDKRNYVLRVEHGKMLEIMGRQTRVILRRFEAKREVEDDDIRVEEFKKEVELRHDILNQYVARMLGIASSSTGRTKIIVIEAVCPVFGTFKSIPELQDTDFFGSMEGLGEEGAKNKRLCVGGLGRMDSRWEDSGWRMDEAFYRLREGDNGHGGENVSFSEYANDFERVRESARKWGEETTKENARDLWNELGWWSGWSEIEQRTESSPSVGEIGWRDGNLWHPIPLVHLFPLALPLDYAMNAHRCDGEQEPIMGMQIGGFTRWSIDVCPGEKIDFRTRVCSYRTGEVADFFAASALSLARDFGVEVPSLRLVSRTSIYVYASFMSSENQFCRVHYFAYPPNSDGSVPDPPGFWSSSPNPLCSEQYFEADAASVRYRTRV